METFAIEWTEWGVHKVMFWEEDPIRKGKILRYIHNFLSNTLIILIVISHTLYPAFWLQTILLFICVLVWLQHLACNGCVVSKVEQKLIGDHESFVTPILEAFHLEPTPELGNVFVIVGSSMGVFLLGLEWLGRIHHMMIPVAGRIFSTAVSVGQQNGII